MLVMRLSWKRREPVSDFQLKKVCSRVLLPTMEIQQVIGKTEHHYLLNLGTTTSVRGSPV